jgi:hypothetical protein
MKTKREGFIENLQFSGQKGEFDISNEKYKEAKYCKITYNGIRLYKDNQTKDAKEIPEGTEKIKYEKSDFKIKIKFDSKKEYIKEFNIIEIAKKAIEKGKEIEIPSNAKSYSCKSGNVIFYSALGKNKKIKDIPEGASAIVFPDFDNYGQQFYYGKPIFKRK